MFWPGEFHGLYSPRGRKESDMTEQLSHHECVDRQSQIKDGRKKGRLRKRKKMNFSLSLGFPCGSAGKESACNARNLGSIPGLGRFPGEGKGYPLQCSGLENSMDFIVHGVTKSQT